MSKIRLLIVGSFPDAGKAVYGGITTSCRALMAPSFSSRYDITTVDSTQISNPPPGFVKRAILSVRRLIIFISHLVKKKPEVVLLFTSAGFSVVEKGLMARLSGFFGVKSLIFPRGGELVDLSRASLIYSMVMSFFLRGADYMICQGPVWQNHAVKVVGFNLNRAPIVYNWTATGSLLEIGRNRVFDPSKKHLQIMFLAWLEESKGIFELLISLNLLRNSFSFELIIAGGGNAEQEARQYVEHHKLQDRIRFIGWVDGDLKKELLATSDIFVLPSWKEGFPNSVIEAMAAKIPVIVTTVGNIPSILDHGEQAYLVPPKDSDALKSALEALLGSPELRSLIAERGFSFACKNFSEVEGLERLAEAIDVASRHART
jgi:glycosyltransferase involved in cell wall biosynthesis